MKKIFNVVLVLFICFLGIKNVSADTVKKVTMSYTVVIRNNQEEVSYPVSINTINGVAVYSFDNLNDISGDYNEIENIDVDSKKLEEILAIAYYGYKYNNRGTTMHYMATQKMIWESFLGDEYSVTFYDRNNNEVNLNKEINYIKNCLSKYDKLPDFEDKLENILYGDYTYIQDNNGVLNDYEITGSDKVMISGNNLKLNTNELGHIDFTLQKKESYENKYKLYKNNNQVLISPGIIKELKKDYHANIISGKITLTLKSIDNKLIDDATFSIYNFDNELIDTKTTRNGVLSFENLKSGLYFIRQESTSNLYNIIDDEINIFLNDNPFYNQEVYNELKIENIKIKINNNKDENLEYEMNLYDENNQFINTYNTFEGSIFLSLPIGNYYLKELDDKFIINFYVGEDEEIVYTYEIEEIHDEENLVDDTKEECAVLDKPVFKDEDKKEENQKEDEIKKEESVENILDEEKDEVNNKYEEVEENNQLEIDNDLEQTTIKVPITEKNSLWGFDLICWIGLGVIYVKKFI